MACSMAPLAHFTLYLGDSFALLKKRTVYSEDAISDSPTDIPIPLIASWLCVPSLRTDSEVCAATQGPMI